MRLSGSQTSTHQIHTPEASVDVIHASGELRWWPFPLGHPSMSRYREVPSITVPASRRADSVRLGSHTDVEALLTPLPPHLGQILRGVRKERAWGPAMAVATRVVLHLKTWSLVAPFDACPALPFQLCQIPVSSSK